MRFFILLTLTFSLTSQAQIISGNLRSTEQEVLSYATIAVTAPLDSTLITGVISTGDGSYVIKGLSPGSYRLTASMTGFQSSSQTIDLYEEDVSLHFVLIEEALDLGEVTVTARKPLYERKIDRTIVNVQNSISNVGVSALEVIANSPGITIDRLSNTITMNGKAGTVIMVNGKRVRLEGQSLLQYLEGLSSGNIDQLELFVTPPANFDAEGNAGLINIIVKRSEDKGTNGSISLFSGYGRRSKYGGSFNLNTRSEKLSYYLDLSSNDNYTRQDIIMTSSNAQEATSNNLFSKRPAYIGMKRINTGLDYSISPTTSLGLGVTGALRSWDMEATTLSTFTNAQGQIISYDQFSHEINDWSDWSFNLNLTQKLGERFKMTVDYDYLDFDNSNPTDYEELEFEENGDLVAERTYYSRKKTPFTFHVGKLDFQGNINEQIRLEFGAKLTVTDFNNDLSFVDVIDGSDQVNDRLSGIFQMDERIEAGYVSSDIQLNDGVLIKAGLRYEHIFSELNSVADGTIFSRNNHRLFPTLFINRKLSETSSLGFSYSRRVIRPNFNVLAPAFYFIDRRTAYTGNTSLRNMLSDHIKIDFSKNGLSASLEFIDYDNPITWAQAAYDEEGIQLIIPEHMSDWRTGALNINYAFDITEWWKNRAEAGFYWQYVEPQAENTGGVTFNDTYIQMNWVQTFDLPKNTSVEWTTTFNSSRQIGVNATPTIVTFNVGLQKEFQNQSKLSLSVSDVFDLGSYFELSSDPRLEDAFNWRYELEGNVFRVSYSMPFGNNKLKVNRRNSASAEERSRI